MGGGLHGGFRGTYGDIQARKHWNCIPNAEKAVIPPEKLTRYSLDPSSDRGGHKAKVFESALGFNLSNADMLVAQILEKVIEHPPVKKGKIEYGDVYTVDIPIVGPNGKTATVRTGWIVKKGDNFPSLTTAYVK